MVHITYAHQELKPGINLEPGEKYTQAIHLMIPTPFKTIGEDYHLGKLVLQRFCFVFSVHFYKKTIEVLEEEIVMMKVIKIGDWDMDAYTFMTVLHGLNRRKVVIKSVYAAIKDDVGDIHYFSKNSDDFEVISIDDTIVTLVRKIGGRFDTSSFDKINYNRGHITIEYTEKVKPCVKNV